jgi:hypothetical protein
MMCTLGNVLMTIGSPAMLSSLAVMNCRPKDIMWLLPLAIISFPLFPAYLLGEKINKQESNNKKLDISSHAFIEHYKNKYYINPFYYSENEGPFDKLDDAKVFLQNLGYREIQNTYWIK